MFGGIFIFAGEVNRRNDLSSNNNLASVVAAVSNVDAQKQRYIILGSNLGELNAKAANISKTDPEYGSTLKQANDVSAEMRSIEDVLITSMSGSDYADLVSLAEKSQADSYNLMERAYKDKLIVADKPISSEAKIVPVYSGTTNTVTQSSVFGKKTYVPLSVIPGLTDSENSTVTMKPFLQLLFKWGIAIAVLLSIVMITFGGFQYMTTDAAFDKSEGKSKINAAIIGLLLALSAWLILQTVDPRILQEPQSAILE